jgi:tryptophan synthase alpha chain
MTNRIIELLEAKKTNLLSVYYTAGFPETGATGKIAQYLQDAGADLLEIGIPFSDPIADGPVIQESNKIALDQGMSLKKLLEQVKEMRAHVTLPIILMGYINPVLQYGVESFCRDASAAGVDGLILPDLPMDVYQDEYQSIFEAYGLSNTFLITPTTSRSRIHRIDEATRGFIYAVAASSTTGAKQGFTPEQESYFATLRNMKLTNPFLIGFGISDHQTFSAACPYGAGAIVGSAFITMLKNSVDLQNDVRDFVNKLRG